ncbi:MAG: hypothetical protein KGI25_04495 [Thaumarchaeota archaeon]|nr:hypothetical protein [Nitrososphaerota archaeon]
MKWLREYLKTNPHVALSVPAILCAIQFLMSLGGAIRTGIFDSNTINQLLSTADGFETVVLFVIMVALKNKKQ